MIHIGSPKLDRSKQDELIMKPYEHIHRVPSKYHKTIGLAFNHWLHVPEDKLDEVGEILQALHTASLLFDDIHDDSLYRYGVPAAHRVFGVGLTVNAASNIFSVALKRILALNRPQAVNIYCEAVLDSHRGQGLDMYWRDNIACPTEEEFFDMTKQKASPFFTFAVQILQLFSDSEENYVPIATLIGMYYAIRDEYCNLFNQGALKSLAANTIQNSKVTLMADNDITEGKFTLPIIHAIRRSNKGQEIINILKKRSDDPELVSHCISLLEELGSAKHTADVLLELESDIEREIKRLGGNPILSKLMKELGNWKRQEDKRTYLVIQQ